MEALQYKCPNCGAEVVFDAAKQKFSCPFCRSEFTEQEMEQLFAQEEAAAAITADSEAQTLDPEKDEQAFTEGTHLYHCDNCGAEIIADEQTSATFCYYCHAPVVLAGRLTGEYCPAWVMPFSVDKKRAEEIFRQWCGKRKFLPPGFNSQGTLDTLTGVYVPFWLTNIVLDAEASGTAKKIRTWKDSNYEYSETKEYAVERKALIPFRGVPEDGSQKIEDALMEAIEPFPYKKMENFSMKYLSGFMAQKYDVGYDNALTRVRKRTDPASMKYLRDDVKGYSSVSFSSSNVQVDQAGHDYVLLPVWFLNYQYGGKDYEFAINGCTGKQAGTPPLCKWKAALFVAGIALAVFAAIVLIGGFLA